jgi:hypothetical protein
MQLPGNRTVSCGYQRWLIGNLAIPCTCTISLRTLLQPLPITPIVYVITYVITYNDSLCHPTKMDVLLNLRIYGLESEIYNRKVSEGSSASIHPSCPMTICKDSKHGKYNLASILIKIWKEHFTAISAVLSKRLV